MDKINIKMYIYTFLLRTTDTITSQNIDISSWNTLYSQMCTDVSEKPYLSYQMLGLTEQHCTLKFCSMSAREVIDS
jgi:hypothetical protein